MNRSPHRFLACAAAATILGLTPSALRATDAGWAPDSLPIPSVIRVSPVSVPGAPRTLVTMAVPVPEMIAGAQTLRFEVKPLGNADIIGRLAGVVARDPNTGAWRPLLLSVRVPADARVGLLDVADVLFHTDDERVVEVPLIIRVPSVLALQIDGPTELADLREGDRVELTYRLTNAGNDVEAVTVRLRAPGGWLGRTADSASTLLAPYSSSEVRLRFRIPVGTNGGEFPLEARLIAASRGDTVAAGVARTRFRILEREIRPPGLVLRPTSAFVASQDGSTLATGVRLEGPVADGIQLRAHVFPRPTLSGMQAIGLASVGALANPFQASLTAPTWSADAGLVTASLSPLTGINVAAQGARVRYAFEGREVVAFAGRSGLVGQSTGAHAGAGAWMRTEIGRVGGSVSVLSEDFGGAFRRDLTAIGADWSQLYGPNWEADAGLAIRHFGRETGLGARAAATRVGERGRLRMSLAHAPGGIEAFASGTDNLQLEGTRELTERWDIDGSATVSNDEGRSGFRNRSAVWSLGQQFAYTRSTSFTLRGSSARLSSEAPGVAAGRFGASSQLLTAGASHRMGPWAFSSTVQAGVVGRDADLLSGATSEVRVLQRGLSLSASRALEGFGFLSTGLSRTATGAGVGQPTDVVHVFARLSDIPVILGGLAVRAHSDVQLIGGAGRVPLLGLRVGADAPIPGGLDLAVSAERNPFFLNRDGRPGWLFAMRLSATAAVFSPRRAGGGGVIFEDRNGNGLRDAGEPGISGVVLRQDGVRISTGRDGRYALPAGVRGRLQLDPTTVPVGLVLAPRIAARLDEQQDFPLVPTGVLTLEMLVDADQDGRRPDVDLSLTTVWLVDADGFEWVGVALDGNRIRFENVPAGRYQVRFDGSRVAEPLRIERGAEVTLRAGETQRHEVGLRGRSVRLIQPPSRGGAGRGSRGSGRSLSSASLAPTDR